MLYSAGATGGAWIDWNASHVISTATSITNAGLAATWNTWNVQTATTCGTTTNVQLYAQSAIGHWISWNNLAERTVGVRPLRTVTAAHAYRERRAREAREAALLQYRKDQAEASKKARRLLYEHLSPPQRKCLRERKFFDVPVGGKVYRIRQGTHGNVRLLDARGHEQVSYCAQPDGVPDEDAMLAQKLMLETDERAFLRVANARGL